MKILMTADTLGGVWTYAQELQRAMPEHEFLIETMEGFKLEWMDDPWDDVDRAGERLLEVERRESPDFIHLNGYAHAALPFRAPKLVVGHSDVLSWWRAVKGERAPESWNTYRRRVEAGLRAADFVVAPSRAMLNALHANYAFNTPSRVIYNASTRQLTTDAKQHVVFAAGRMWDEAKNLRAVIQAAPRIEAPVKIAGDGGYDAPNVQHLGKLDRNAMQRAFGEAAIYLFPALYEPFGLSILEAALARCALVIGDIPSLREIWRDAAIFVPPRDVDAIASEVNALLADSDRLDEMRRRAQKRAAMFTPKRMADAYGTLYRELRTANRELGVPA
jgi:glycosyltransferase involved in cell wall biosynthesis